MISIPLIDLQVVAILIKIAGPCIAGALAVWRKCWRRRSAPQNRVVIATPEEIQKFSRRAESIRITKGLSDDLRPFGFSMG
jgi:hypothetical protein